MSIFVTSGTIGYSFGPIFITYAVEYLGPIGPICNDSRIIVFLSLYFLLPSGHSLLRQTVAPAWDGLLKVLRLPLLFSTCLLSYARRFRFALELLPSPPPEPQRLSVRAS
jgi:hypothetical protein